MWGTFGGSREMWGTFNKGSGIWLAIMALWLGLRCRSTNKAVCVLRMVDCLLVFLEASSKSIKRFPDQALLATFAQFACGSQCQSGCRARLRPSLQNTLDGCRLVSFGDLLALQLTHGLINQANLVKNPKIQQKTNNFPK